MCRWHFILRKFKEEDKITNKDIKWRVIQISVKEIQHQKKKILVYSCQTNIEMCLKLVASLTHWHDSGRLWKKFSKLREIASRV